MNFYSTNAAISVLRAGKRHPRWKEAAEYVIDRASPEVVLLLDVGRQLERDEMAVEERKNQKSGISLAEVLRYGAIIITTALVSGCLGYLASGLITLC